MIASTALALLLHFKLTNPAPYGTFAKLHVFTDLADAQAWSLRLASKVLQDFRLFTSAAI